MDELEFFKKKALQYERGQNIALLKYNILAGLEEDKAKHNLRQRLCGQEIYIYGKGVIGKKLCSILERIPDVKVNAFIEKSFSDWEADVPVYSLETDLSCIHESAIIVITPMDYYNEIMADIEGMALKNPTLSITDILV